MVCLTFFGATVSPRLSSKILIEAHRYISQMILKTAFYGGSSEKSLIQTLNFFQDMNFFTKSKSDKGQVAQSL